LGNKTEGKDDESRLISWI